MAKQAEKAIKELIDKDGRKNLEALGKGVGLDAAMFGRMVTGDVLARVDAAVHVAHAFTVHKQQSEADYFSAIDELKRERGGEDAQGSGHINSSELTSGLYYGYVVIDVPLMLANLEGTKPDDWQKADRKLARDVVGSLLHSITTVSPGAKLGSTAPHSSAHLLLVESGDDAQPRTLANAFMKAVRTDDECSPQATAGSRTYRRPRADVPEPRFARRLAALGDARALLDAIGQKEKLSVDAIAEWSREQV
jgi:CRISPR system Cascade subunit CasC